MQLLAFKEPKGRVFILDELQALPPLAEGYEWTMVVQPVVQPDRPSVEASESDSADETRAADSSDDLGDVQAKKPAENPGFFDALLELLTPAPGQTPTERGHQLFLALPADIQRDLAKLATLFQPKNLPAFPRG